MRYKAFISYSHSEDSHFSPALQSTLEKYAKKWYQTRRIRIFRDETNLTISPALWPSIVESLGEAEYFILLASPASGGSRWVKKEIEWWLKNRGKQKLLIILTSGTILWDSNNTCLTGSSIPSELSSTFDSEPFYLDLRWVKDSPNKASIDNLRFQNAIVPLAAVLLNQDMDLLIGENARQIRIRRQFIQSTIISLVTLSLFLIYLSFSLNKQTRLAISARDQAEKNELTANLNLARMYEERSQFSLQQSIQSKSNTQNYFQKSWLYALKALALKIPVNEKNLSDALLLKINNGDVSNIAFKVRREAIPLPAPESKIKAIYYIDNERIIILKDNDNIYLLDKKTKKILKNKKIDQKITQTTSSENGKSIAFSTDKSTIKILNIDLWKDDVITNTEADEVTALSFNHNSNILAAGLTFNKNPHDFSSRSYSVFLWDTLTGKEINRFKTNSEVRSLVFSQDSKVLAVGLDIWEADAMWDMVEYGNTIIFLDYYSSTHTSKEIINSTLPIDKIIYSKSKNEIVTVSQDITSNERKSHISILDVSSEGIKRRFSDIPGTIRDIQLSPNDNNILAYASDSKIKLLDIESNNLNLELNSNTSVSSISFSPNGNHIASNSFDKGLNLWDISFSEPVKKSTSDISTLDRTKDDDLVVLLSDDLTLTLINNRTGEVNKILEQKGVNSVTAATISPDGKKIVYATNDNKLFFWDTLTKKQDFDIVDFLDLSYDESLYYADLANPFTHHMSASIPFGHISSISFSPDGSVLAAGTTKNTIQIWNSSKSKKRTFGMPLYGTELTGHNGTINKIVFNNNGTLMASASNDDTIRVWSIKHVESDEDSHAYGIQKQVIECESVKQLYFDDLGKLHATGIQDNTEYQCKPTTLTFRLFDEFDPSIVSQALELIWEVSFDNSGTDLIYTSATQPHSMNSCGYHYDINNRSLLTAPKEHDSKLDQLITWLENECAYKDKLKQAECLSKETN